MDNKSGNKCGAKMEIWSRVVGYYRPTKYFNKGKQEEYNTRKTFKLNEEVVNKGAKKKKQSLFAVA